MHWEGEGNEEMEIFHTWLRWGCRRGLYQFLLVFTFPLFIFSLFFLFFLSSFYWGWEGGGGGLGTCLPVATCVPLMLVQSMSAATDSVFFKG